MRLRRKVASRDFMADMMPHSRKEVFFDVLKLHWFELLMLGLLLLIAFIPVVILHVVNDVYEYQILSGLNEQAEESVRQSALASVASFRSTNSIFEIVFYCIFGIVFAGILRVIRQYAWEEVVFFWRDIWLGIRQNGKQVVGIAIVLGIHNAIHTYLNGLGSVTGDTFLRTASSMWAGLTALIILPVCAIACVLVPVYDNTFWQNIKVALTVYAKSLFKTILLLPALGTPFLISLIPTFVCHLIGRIAGSVLLPSTLLIWFLFVSAQLDKHINPRFFPELVGRGLYQGKSASESTETEDPDQDTE